MIKHFSDSKGSHTRSGFYSRLSAQANLNVGVIHKPIIPVLMYWAWAGIQVRVKSGTHPLTGL